MKLKLVAVTAVLYLGSGVAYAGDTIIELNIDLGNAHGSPSDAYGALPGQTGRWNTVGLGGTSNLLDTAAQVTPVSISVTAESDQGLDSHCLELDDRYFADDNIFTDAKTWSVILADLPNGTYELYLYAPTNDIVATGTMNINGVVIPSMQGSITCDLSEGAGSVRFWVDVLSGAITIAGDPSGTGFDYAGLAGLQLRGPVVYNSDFESGDFGDWFIFPEQP